MERYIFNFRLRPDALAKQLPVPWLKPQVINGWSVVSFCVLSIEGLTLRPFRAFRKTTSTSCAYRCGVIDDSISPAESSVYITDRNTDLPLASRLAPLLFCDSIPVVRVAIAKSDRFVEVTASYLDGQHLFSAEMPVREHLEFDSKVFRTIEDFVAFIKGGVSSYTPSIYPDRLARVDLYKEDAHYEPVEAEVDYSWLDGAWRDAGLEFDSAIRAAGGGRYVWTFRGLTSSVRALSPPETLPAAQPSDG